MRKPSLEQLHLNGSGVEKRENRMEKKNYKLNSLGRKFRKKQTTYSKTWMLERMQFIGIIEINWLLTFYENFSDNTLLLHLLGLGLCLFFFFFDIQNSIFLNQN